MIILIGVLKENGKIVKRKFKLTKFFFNTIIKK